MIHLAYPNVENGRFRACVRYLSLPGEQEPGPLYYPAAPNAGNLMAVRQATRDLIPEWGQRGYEARVYEKRDLPGTLRGDSLELAYFLALVRCVYPLVLEAVAEVGDVWCTGVMEYLNGKPVLKYVQEPGFTAKLAGFLAQAQDRIFLVPAANVYHAQEHICREHDVHVLTLPAFRKAVQVAMAAGRWQDKVVVTLEGVELLEVVDTLFKRPPSFASAEPNYDLPGVWVEQAAHLHTLIRETARDVPPDVQGFDLRPRHAASSLAQGLRSASWRPYLETIAQHSTEPLTEAHAREVLQAQWTLLVCPYAEDKQAPLHALAAWCARWWLQGDETLAVPLFLPVGRFQAGGQQDRLSLEGLSAAIRVDPGPGLAPTLLQDQLRAGALILLEGADAWARFADGERLPALVQALATLCATSALTRVALTCNEATAEGLTVLLQQYAIHPRPLSLYEGRSNFLDRHRSAVVKGARSRILTCQLGALGRTLTPEQFFYEPTNPLYVRIGVREEGTEPKPLDEVLLAAHNASPAAPRLLLLGDGGAGKSTALLKLFLDCVAPQSSSPLKGRLTPWLLRLGPLFAPWRQEPQGLTLDTLLRRLHEGIGWGTVLFERDNTPLFRTAIQWTPGLLLLLDGLDEIQPATPAARDAISRVLAEFLALCPAAWVVLTSRQSEAYRGERSLLRSSLFEAWRQLEIDELTWSDIDLYLQRAGHAAADARARHALLTSHPGLLQQPLLLYLFATTPLAALQGQPLTRARLFREAVQTWLQQELNEKLPALRVTFPPGPPVEGLVQLIGLVAVRMLEQAQDALQDEDVAAALRREIASHPQPHAWWPRTKDGRGFGYGPPVHDAEVWELVHCLKGLCVFTEGFHFQHEAFREYFAAEALRALCEVGLRVDASSDVRQATLHELECLTREYATWGPALSLLPDLLRERAVVQALIDWCEHGQAQLFGLDCLPALYACAGDVEALWRRVRDDAFQQQKLAQHEPCWRSLVADVRLALEHAIQAQRLPEMVRFGLLLPWATWAVGLPATSRPWPCKAGTRPRCSTSIS